MFGSTQLRTAGSGRRRISTLAVAVVVLLTVGLPASTLFAATAPKVGAACTKVNAAGKDKRGKAVVCKIKKGKKVWQAVATTPSTVAVTTATSAPVPGKGLAKTAGFDGKTIRVGVITALSGPAAVLGKPLAAGQEVFWKYYNEEKGGIAGRYPVEVVLEDNLYESNTTVQKYNKIKDNVVILSQVMGTAPTLALLPLLKADNVVASPASQDALWVREQNLFPIIEPYQVDAINAMDYVMKSLGGKNKTICAVIQNDVYGEEPKCDTRIIFDKKEQRGNMKQRTA